MSDLILILIVLLSIVMQILCLRPIDPEMIIKKEFSIDNYEIKVYEEHPKVLDTAIKHCNTWDKYNSMTKIAQHTDQSFQEAVQFVNNFYISSQVSDSSKYVIIDSGCGVGQSSIKLASKYPHLPVIGIDRSVYRLSKNQVAKDDDLCPPNLLLLRAELVDFWYLACMTTDWIIKHHYMLYPNPYPKSKHLQRRWHGHPIFPCILALGGQLVVRSNWPIYCQEMHTAITGVIQTYNDPTYISPHHNHINKYIQYANDNNTLTNHMNTDSLSSSHTIKGENKDSVTLSSQISIKLSQFQNPIDPMTLFEKKYAAAGQTLHQLEVDFPLRNKNERIEFLKYLCR